MLTVEHLETFNIEGALRGMRNPKNSWDKSDSQWDATVSYAGFDNDALEYNFTVGSKDLKLMERLAFAGTDHRKYLRQMLISCDITAPLFWWKQFDQYKVGTVTNSCSTMHKLTAKKFELDDFSSDSMSFNGLDFLKDQIAMLNMQLDYYNSSKSASAWRDMVCMLPSCYNQKRTVTLNYEVALNFYLARKDHKLSEWNTLCELLYDELPYFQEIVKAVEK